MVELLGRLNKDGKDITETPIPPERLAAMLGLLAKGAISGKMAKEFFRPLPVYLGFRAMAILRPAAITRSSP